MELFKEVLKLFVGKEYSLTSKFLGILTIGFLLFFIDNLLGFTFFYSTNQKIDQIEKIESIKIKSSQNLELIEELNNIETKILNRKNILGNFIDLFSKEPFDTKRKLLASIKDTVGMDGDSIQRISPIDSCSNKEINKYDTLFNDLDENKQSISNTTSENIENTSPIIKQPVLKSRSRIWHTLTSSYFFVLILIIMPFVPFTQEKIDKNLLIGIAIFMVVDIGFIWMSQLILGLIPVILNKPWVNYILNFIIHTTFILICYGIAYGTKKKVIR